MADTNLQGFRPLMGFLNFKYFSNSGTNSANCFRPLMGFLNFKLAFSDEREFLAFMFPSPYGVS